MRRLLYASTVAVALALIAPVVHLTAQRGMGNADRVVPGGGITVQGWKAALDKSSIDQGRTANDSKFSQEGGVLKLAVGPAAVYWNPANTAKGDYTVKGTFTEPTFQTVNDHPHSYGPFIAGNKMGEAGMSLLYCTPYGNGTFIVRGFGDAPPAANGAPATFPSGQERRAAANPAVHKAEGIGKPVTNEVALSVKGDVVSCSINGTEVWKTTKAEIVGPGKLASTDGVFGIRVTHNVDVEVKGFGKS